MITKLKLGARAYIVSDILENDSSNLEPLKGFLSIFNDKNFVKNCFSKLYVLFNVLNKNSYHFNDANKIYTENKNYSELYSNIVKNPPNNAKIFDAMRRYQGVDCGKINRSLAENENPNKIVKSEIKILKEYLDSQNLSTPITLFRGESLNALGAVKADNRTIDLKKMLLDVQFDNKKMESLNTFLKSSDVTLEKPSFMSTTMSKRVCLDFGHESFYWQLTTAPNTKACLVSPLTEDKNLNNEKEVLLQAGSKIKIKGAFYDDKNSIWCLKGEVSTN